MVRREAAPPLLDDGIAHLRSLHGAHDLRRRSSHWVRRLVTEEAGGRPPSGGGGVAAGAAPCGQGQRLRWQRCRSRGAYFAPARRRSAAVIALAGATTLLRGAPPPRRCSLPCRSGEVPRGGPRADGRPTQALQYPRLIVAVHRDAAVVFREYAQVDEGDVGNIERQNVAVEELSKAWVQSRGVLGAVHVRTVRSTARRAGRRVRLPANQARLLRRLFWRAALRCLVNGSLVLKRRQRLRAFDKAFLRLPSHVLVGVRADGMALAGYGCFFPSGTALLACPSICSLRFLVSFSSSSLRCRSCSSCRTCRCGERGAGGLVVQAVHVHLHDGQVPPGPLQMELAL
mmetsp:Transcript_81127/g.234595  ORF Transcript_81127/g.234595 Transcript_81127/m.234595 type:complete len:343 (-) Transcript_81127:194-1222(-)